MNLQLIFFVCFIFTGTSASDWNQFAKGVEKAFENLERAGEFLIENLEAVMEKVAEKVEEWSKSDGINPEELSRYSESDMIYQLLNGYLNPKISYWPDGRIPYKITGTFSFSEREMIANAIEDFHEHTCVRFVPRIRERAYIRISSKRGGCFSSIGYGGSVYDVNLQTPQCLTMKGTVVHELMHAAGFIHEQSRNDRDNYVTINWSNIGLSDRYNFKKYPSDYTDEEYDYGSVMHYSSHAFARNPLYPAIVAKSNPNIKLGQRIGLSKNDIRKINKIYHCSGQTDMRKNIIDETENPAGDNSQTDMSSGRYIPEEHNIKTGNSKYINPEYTYGLGDSNSRSLDSKYIYGNANSNREPESFSTRYVSPEYTYGTESSNSKYINPEYTYGPESSNTRNVDPEYTYGTESSNSKYVNPEYIYGSESSNTRYVTPEYTYGPKRSNNRYVTPGYSYQERNSNARSRVPTYTYRTKNSNPGYVTGEYTFGNTDSFPGRGKLTYSYGTNGFDADFNYGSYQRWD